MQVSALSLPDRVEKRIYWILVTSIALPLVLAVPIMLLFGEQMAFLAVGAVTLFTGALAVVVAFVGSVMWETRLVVRPRLFTGFVAITSGVITGLTTGFIEPQFVGSLERGPFGVVFLVFAYLFTYAMFPVRSGISEGDAGDRSVE